MIEQNLESMGMDAQQILRQTLDGLMLILIMKLGNNIVIPFEELEKLNHDFTFRLDNNTKAFTLIAKEREIDHETLHTRIYDVPTDECDSQNGQD